MSDQEMLSRSQEQVLEILKNESKPLTAYELLALTKAFNIHAPTQVYRILNQLVKKGLVIRIASLNMYVAFQSKNKNEHPIFSTCTNCRTVEHISISDKSPFIANLINRKHFVPDAFYFEVVGKCAECASKKI